MYNLQRVIKTQDTKNVPVQNKYNSPDGWEMEYLTFPGLTKTGCVRHLFTTRTGGTSSGIFESLNLSFTRGDDRDCVLQNYDRVAEVLGITRDRIVCSDQTHTTNIRIVTKEDAGKGIDRQRDYADIDGLVTNEKGLALATFYADCVPLYFVDPVREVIGLAHSGWRGTVAGMGKKMVERMHAAFGCDPADIHAAIGPSICQECYEVSSDVAEEFQKAFAGMNGAETLLYQKPEQKAEGKYQLDLWLANQLWLTDAGITPEHLEVTNVCTAHNPAYLFSHRKTNGKRGNLGAFLCLKENGTAGSRNTDKGTESSGKGNPDGNRQCSQGGHLGRHLRRAWCGYFPDKYFHQDGN